MQTKLTTIAILLGAILTGGIILLSGNPSDRAGAPNNIGAAVLEDGIQYVDITAHVGYTPRITKATAGVPTIIRMNTQNTYDCSVALVIPELGYQTYLPQSGVTEIEVPAGKARGTLRGMCSMAMYHFQIDFE